MSRKSRPTTGRHSLRIAVVGGAGHVGLPLSLILADRGFCVTVVDTDETKLRLIAEDGIFPFREEGGAELLAKLRRLGREPEYTCHHKAVENCDVIIVTVGTPVDGHLNADLGPIYDMLAQLRPYLHSGQILVLRSTLFPGTSEKIRQSLQASQLDIGVSFCPERIAEGYALVEIPAIPQIISASDPRTLALVKRVFSALTPTVVELPLIEAEMAKLFSNAWRYIKFAVANQFYMMATEKGLDFYRIRHAMITEYQRAADFPTAGFAAGPCLFKDTIQLAAFNRQQFALGHAAMLVNETLPDYLVDRVKAEIPLGNRCVGILGMAFKPDSDDPRESLAYKLRKLLSYEGATVLCTDPFIADPEFVSVERVLEAAEVIFIGCPHTAYRKLKLAGRNVIDCWGVLGRETRK